MYKKYIVTALILLSSMAAFGAKPAVAYINTDAKLEYNKGIDFYSNGEFDKAIDCFRNAIELEPNYVDAYYNLATTFEYLKQYEASASVFRELLNRKPDDYAAAYRAAIVSYKMKNIPLAKDFLSKLSEVSPFYYQAQELATLMGTDMKSIKASSIPDDETVPIFSSDIKTSISDNTLPALPDVEIGESKYKPSTFAGNFFYDNIPSPTGITTDDLGYLYVADYSDNAIFRITPTGEKTVFLKGPKIKGPIGIVFDDSGNLYIANYNGNNVLKLSRSNNLSTVIENIEKPYYLHVKNGFLFVSSQGSNNVLRYKID